MKHLLTLALMSSLMLPMAAPKSEAGILSRACMGSDRKAKSSRLCNCIQRMANGNLSRTDQKIAAKFFKEPHKAQVVRQSSNIIYERFWEKYKRFGAKVATACR